MNLHIECRVPSFKNLIGLTLCQVTTTKFKISENYVIDQHKLVHNCEVGMKHGFIFLFSSE